jgi:hypothetical protein
MVESHRYEMLISMGVALPEIADMSRAVVLEHGRGLDVLAVTATEGGTDRVEVLVTITGCHQGPCRFLVNVTRTGSGAFEDDFRLKLRDALQKHAALAV